MTKKLLAALILSSFIISFSGCEKTPEIPVSSPEISSSESSSISESVPEIEITPESSSEPEETAEPEPVIEPVVNILSNTAGRGGYYIISAENIDLSGFVFEDPFGNDRRFFEKEEIWYCLLPVDSSVSAGYYPLYFTIGDFEFRTTVTVEEREFKKQYLRVEQETLDATLEDAAVRESFAAFFEEIRWHFSEKILWEGEFVKPLGDSRYKETTSFGTFRTFSNGKTEWHNATDMAAGGGTPIYATNSGNVIFADWLGLTGYTIIIDHGCGIMSWHYHLHEISVSEGDFVEKNALIGTVGTTGLSTGNHLHFGITIGGIFTDPMAMIGTEPYLDFEKVKAE